MNVAPWHTSAPFVASSVRSRSSWRFFGFGGGSKPFSMGHMRVATIRLTNPTPTHRSTRWRLQEVSYTACSRRTLTRVGLSNVCPTAASNENVKLNEVDLPAARNGGTFRTTHRLDHLIQPTNALTAGLLLAVIGVHGIGVDQRHGRDRCRSRGTLRLQSRRRHNNPGQAGRDPLRLARYYKSLLDTGKFESRAALARFLGVSRARM